MTSAEIRISVEDIARQYLLIKAEVADGGVRDFIHGRHNLWVIEDEMGEVTGAIQDFFSEMP